MKSSNATILAALLSQSFIFGCLAVGSGRDAPSTSALDSDAGEESEGDDARSFEDAAAAADVVGKGDAATSNDGWIDSGGKDASVSDASLPPPPATQSTTLKVGSWSYVSTEVGIRRSTALGGGAGASDLTSYVFQIDDDINMMIKINSGTNYVGVGSYPCVAKASTSSKPPLGAATIAITPYKDGLPTSDSYSSQPSSCTVYITHVGTGQYALPSISGTIAGTVLAASGQYEAISASFTWDYSN